MGATMPALHPLTTLADLDTAIAASHERPVLLFKHSATCGLSGLAHEDVRDALAEPSARGLLTSMVVVQTHREISAAITERLRVWHASPQVLLICDGQVRWHTSHAAIRARTILDALTRLDCAAAS
jgi:bacillithiol system protein YtxJ